MNLLQIVATCANVCFDLQKAADVCAAVMTRAYKVFSVMTSPIPSATCTLHTLGTSCKITEKSYGRNLGSETGGVIGPVLSVMGQ